MKNKSIVWLFLGAALFFSPSCEKNPIDTLCSPNVLNLDKFEEALLAELDGQVMGYAYIISQDGVSKRSGADGWARTGTDGQKAMSINEKMQVASVSKNITTAAALAVCELKGIDVNASIADYLPPHWSLGPGINNVSIYDLLWQGAGLNTLGTQNFSATRYDSLQAYIAAGAQQPKVRTYSNTHHGMFRVLLPRMWDVPRPADGSYDEDFCTSVYKQCVQKVLFEKIGIFNTDCKPPANNPLLGYSGPNDNAGSGGTSDFSDVAGGTGWNLTAEETAKYWAYLWHSNTLINQQSRDLMRNNTLGLWNSVNGDKGLYYCKLGGWNFGGNDWMRSAVMHFPDGVQVTLFVNSPNTNGKALNNLCRDAYDNGFGC
ncbi:MAG: beta-lactamase family protein [Saprospiraceae bacterium]|nr:beta-lactamase family protein [Saprospiraceae bacterium]